MPKKRIYLDYASTTPLDPAVRRVMALYEAKKFGNPGSIHSFGQEAIAALDKARETIAHTISAQFGEIIFTGSATEANNLALRGIIKGSRVQGLGFRKEKPRIIVSAIEHESILETARDLESEGVEVIIIPVSKEGIIDLEKLKNALTPETVLVSVMYANNEIGTIQPIKEIAEIIKEFHQQIANPKRINEFEHSKKIRYSMMKPLFHTDAVQAFQYLDVNVDTLGVDLMTLSAHKLYGPKGVGALYVRRGSRVQGLGSRKEINTSTLNPKPLPDRQAGYTLYPITTGGGQEYGLRSGTENVAGIVGFGEAVRRSALIRDKESKRVTQLQEKLFSLIERQLPDVQINGTKENRLPNNVHLYIPGSDAHELVVAMDLKGFAISAGSACAARTSEPSKVVRALGFSEGRARESIRITLGRATSAKDIDACVKELLQLRKA